jgi:hypothetical protein
MTAMARWPFAIVAGLLVAGCASVPSAPTVMALPGSAKSAEEFKVDDAACREAAAADAKATKKWRYDMTYLQCMYAKGNQIPVPSGVFQPTPASPASSTPAASPAATSAPASSPATPASPSVTPANPPATSASQPAK